MSALSAPSDVSFAPEDIGGSVLLAVALLVLLKLPIFIINSTAEANSDLLAGWLRPARGLRGGPLGDWVSGLPFVAQVAAAASITGMLYGFLEPSFPFDRSAHTLVLGLAIALLAIQVVIHLPAMAYLRRTGTGFNVVLQPGFLVVVIACVVVSRLLDLHPGLLLGPLLGFQAAEASVRHGGRARALAQLCVATLAVSAWLTRAPVVDGLGGPESFAGETAAVAWTVMVVSGFQIVAFLMTPIRFLPGARVLAWSKAAWLLLWLLGWFGLVHIVFHTSLLASPGRGVADLATMFAIYFVAAIAVWAYCRYRREHSSNHIGPSPVAPSIGNGR